MYYSSRNHENMVSSSKALVSGIANDGGLFLIDKIPSFSLCQEDLNLSYKQLTKKILRMYLDDFTKEEIDYCVESAYSKKNFPQEMVVVKSFKDHSFLELFKGPTAAFKDMALTLLPYLLQVAMKKQNVKKIKIITATSGDTGSAALSAFKDVDNIEIAVLYPDHGISLIQEKQMLHFTSANARAYSLKDGNFDDCQKEVKKALTFKDDEVLLSSANSINIGRLIPQVVYYYYGYMQLVKNGSINLDEKIDVVVPTGNFGNIFACYLAKQMGLPIEKLVCASNCNDVLDEFFKTGKYNANRQFYVTNSPSMDILVSSNLERLLALVSSEEELNTYMSNLKMHKCFEVSENTKNKLASFISYHADETQTLQAIKESFEEDQYLIDPHTAVAYYCAKKVKDNRHQLIASTASFFKFPLTIKKALGLTSNYEIELLSEIEEVSKVKLPVSLQNVVKCEVKKKFITAEQFEKSLFAKKQFVISVPASSANLACGFDVCGLAYDFVNKFSFKQAKENKFINFNPKYCDEYNLVYQSYKYVFEKNDLKLQPVIIEQLENNVPDSRGLGSSATCIVAGVLAANKMLNDRFNEDYLIQMMSELEGHPDNVSCCYLGEFVSAFKDEQGKIYYQKWHVNEELKFILCIPRQHLQTLLSRSVLPKEIKIADSVFDASRLIQLPKALEDGDLKKLSLIMDDKIHQPYRLPLIKEAKKIKEFAASQNLPFALSGAGSTLLIICKDETILEKLANLPLDAEFTFKQLKLSKNGASVEEVV